MKNTGLLHPTTELRQLIIDNPGLPLLVFAGEYANYGGEFSYMSCSVIRTEVGEFLDCQQTVNDTHCYTDRDEFQEDLEEQYYSDFHGTDSEFNELIESELEKYEPYWKPCIILWIDN